jgi:Uma2 family endonuclease
MTEQSEKVPFWEEMGLPAPGARLNLAEWDALPEVNIRIEWHDGLILYPNYSEETGRPTPIVIHQLRVISILSYLMDTIPNGRMMLSPVALHLGKYIVQPDVFWIAENSACLDKTSHLEGPPELIVEILSPDNIANDRVTKFDLYERSGVSEY